jgi:transcriptional regulator with XRE-family HTH domain
MQNGQFRDAKAHLDELARVERREERRLSRPVDKWFERGALTHEALDHLRDLRLQEREDILPKDRRCPRCGVVKISSRQWVILVDDMWDKRWRAKLHAWVRAKARELETAAEQGRDPVLLKNPFGSICRSCYMIEPIEEPLQQFLELELWWKLDHKAVKVARFELDATGAEIAAACGWSQSRQSKIETRAVSLLSDDDISKLQLALQLNTRPVVGEPVLRYNLSGKALMTARRAVGVSRKALAEVMGVSASRVTALERKKLTRIEPRVAECLTQALFGISSLLAEEDAGQG